MRQENKNCIDENMSLDIDVSDVFVVKNAKKRAFIEQFNYSSINFTQKDLGVILGFFAVRDNSSSSENIVNFLASEVKKHYFLPVNKNAGNKFESTLHHVNRVLEEIANVGNVEWLGTIDGAICVIADSSIYFSITGDAYVFILRDNTLIDISEGLTSDEAKEQPLKTFSDISSGEICADDKIIITSKELLDFVTFEELQKNAIRFGQKGFIQFIETVLHNECSVASTMIIDVDQKESPQIYTEAQKEKDLPENFFGADAFEEDEEQVEQKEKQENAVIEETIDELISDTATERVDEKTGHIYIQGSDEIPQEHTIMDTLSEKWTDFTEVTKEALSKKKTRVAKKISQYKKDRESLKEEKRTEEEKYVTENEMEHAPEVEIVPQDTQQPFYEKIKTIIHDFYFSVKKSAKNISTQCVNSIKHYKERTSKKHTRQIKGSETYHDTTSTGVFERLQSLLPNPQHVTRLWNNMSSQTKWIAIGILIFIIAVPIIFATTSRKSEKPWPEIPEETGQQEVVVPEEPQEEVSNNTIPDPQKLISDTESVATIWMDNKHIGVTNNSIVLFDGADKKDYSLPEGSGDTVLATPMNDLNLLFILTKNNKLYTFSPVDKKFAEQKNIPAFDYTKIKSIGTYMTYFYTMDGDMITRYARKENGFDGGTKWLKEDVNISDTEIMAIDDDIYTLKQGTITKFTKGKKVSFTQDVNIKSPSLIYTTEDTEFMWILDKENKTLFKTEKSTGKKIDDYIHDAFADTIMLSVSEKDNIATITKSTEILSFDLTSEN